MNEFELTQYVFVKVLKCQNVSGWKHKGGCQWFATKMFLVGNVKEAANDSLFQEYVTGDWEIVIIITVFEDLGKIVV